MTLSQLQEKYNQRIKNMNRRKKVQEVILPKSEMYPSSYGVKIILHKTKNHPMSTPMFGQK